jgi:hypothetical protein
VKQGILLVEILQKLYHEQGFCTTSVAKSSDSAEKSCASNQLQIQI